MPVILVPILIKYGFPLATYGIGHLVGWLHGKFSKKAVIVPTPVVNKP